jgi:ABC-type multidrug transport system fused ATPase/permease subunit
MSDEKLDWGDSPEVSEQTTSYFVRGMKTLWDLIAVERKRIFWSIVVLVFVEGISLSIPLLFRELVDYVPVVLKEGITPFVMCSVSAMFMVRIATLVIRRFVQEPMFL